MLRKMIVAAIGGTFLVVGVLMVLLPGPALIFIPLGIGILAIEFEWARRLWKWAKEKIRGK
ncbi:MAG: hypothetical protein FJ215_10935 [Ignavibacteria bacterium]|nr:hypothetical protein [Ignavibacteria bacterium]